MEAVRQNLSPKMISVPFGNSMHYSAIHDEFNYAENNEVVIF